MKVRATIEPAGLWVTSDVLNVPGQTFTGTVEDNLIEGTFEIEHRRYDGSDAPPYPPDFTEDESLTEYLEPGDLCESDDPVLVAKARDIAEGSSDSWEAACRLSRWVSENISYAIPGGMTARNTFDTGSGECGAHSLLLAAFCRAVGIPARVVWGCMYIPNFGGSFGQHGWNEIYMGSAGWIPVDATAAEIDYIDSGHIRIGVLESMTTFLNPGEMEVLDYRAGSLKMGDVEEAVPAEYEPFVGEYTSVGEDRSVLKAFVQGGRLAVDIPEKVILALEDPDEDGLWFCTLTRDLYFVFNEDDSGRAVEMEIHELISMPKQSGPEEMDEAAPEEMRPYLGEYIFPPLQARFTVLYKEGSLAIDDPLEKRVVKLKAPDENGRWLDEFDKNTISFELDDDGAVTAMRVDAVSRFTR
jgi:transglutaminase-like putative cysteine protease